MHSPPTPPRPSPALLLALAGAALMLLLQALPGAPSALEYRRLLLAGEPWRVLTAHLVHVNWTHALVNAAAWLVLAPLFSPQFGARLQLLVLAIGALFTSLGLAIVYPSIEWYRGASGVLHSLFFAGSAAALVQAWRRHSWPALFLSAALVAGGWIKVALDVPRDGATAYAEWLAAATVPQAHLLGAIAGTALGLLLAARRPARGAISG